MSFNKNIRFFFLKLNGAGESKVPSPGNSYTFIQKTWLIKAVLVATAVYMLYTTGQPGFYRSYATDSSSLLTGAAFILGGLGFLFVAGIESFHKTFDIDVNSKIHVAYRYFWRTLHWSGDASSVQAIQILSYGDGDGGTIIGLGLKLHSGHVFWLGMHRSIDDAKLQGKAICEALKITLEPEILNGERVNTDYFWRARRVMK